MPLSNRRKLFLPLLILLALVLSGSDIEQPSPFCPECVKDGTVLDTSLKGGLIGGPSGAAGTYVMFDAATSSTAGRIPFPVAAVLNGGPAVCFPTGVDPLTKNVIDAVFVKRSADGVSTLLNLGRSTANPTAAAGCYGQSLYAFTIAEFEQLEVMLTDILAGSEISWAADLRGTTAQPLAAYYATGTVTAASTVYSGAGQGRTLAAVLTVEGTAGNVMPYAGTASKFCVRTTTSQPATGALVVTLRKNGAGGTGVAVTIEASQGPGLECDPDSLAFAATDWYTWELANAAPAAVSAQVNNVSMLYTPTVSPKATFFFPKANNALTASANNYFFPYAAAARSATETDKWGAITRAGALVSLYCYVQTAPANNITVTVQQSGAPTAATGTITAAGGTGVKTVWTGSLSVAANAGHSINFATGAGAQAVIPQCAMEFN